MSRKIAAGTVLALIVEAVFPSAASSDERRKVIAVPVSVNFGDYEPAHEGLQNAVEAKLMKSQLVTPNVDAYRALVVVARLKHVRGRGQTVTVTYSWDRKTIGRAIYACSQSEVGRCSANIVRGAERASATVRQSPSWLR